MQKPKNVFKTVSLKELVAILLWVEENSVTSNIKRRIKQRTTDEASEQKPDTEVPAQDQDAQNTILKSLSRAIYETIAKRLQRNNRAICLVNKRDFKIIFSQVSEFATSLVDEEDGPELKKFMESFSAKLFDGLGDMLATTTAAKIEKSYRAWERQVRTIQKLANERGLSIDDFILLPDAADLMIRATTTRKQFLASVKKMFGVKSSFMKKLGNVINDGLLASLRAMAPHIDMDDIPEDELAKFREEFQVILKRYQAVAFEESEAEADRLWPQ